MNYLKGIPILHNGIFIYDLDINNSNIINYLNISFFNHIQKDEAEHSYITKSKSVLNDLPDLKNEISKAINHLINDTLKTKADFSIYNSWGTQKWQFTQTKKWSGYMFNNTFKLPTYSEWKESVEKINADVMKFWNDWYEDIKKSIEKR
jgi:hypothetical protein